jgi:release factor glutamine methyltransferase
MIISELLKKSAKQLEKISDSARLDTEVLLCFILEKNRSYLMTWPEKELNEDQFNNFQTVFKKRQQGTPLAHITGHKEFWSLNLKVTRDTLIPRPETELLIEQILESFPTTEKKTLLDLGTGSGAIAIAIASERKHWKIIATDQSSAALDIAIENARSLNISNIEFKQGSWFQAIEDKAFDIIVSNPPYIVNTDPHLKSGDVRFEPLSALASGVEGLDDIHTIVSQAKQHLNPGGFLIIEHGYDQKAAVNGIFNNNGLNNVTQHHDLANNPRTTSGFI